MKKFYLIILALAIVSCDKADRIIEEYSGTYERNTSVAESYMTVLASKLVPDYLIALEAALLYDTYGYYTGTLGQSDYDSNGQSIRTEGVTWTVDAKKKVAGLKITCKGHDTWELSREGEYSYDPDGRDKDYITACTMTAVMGEEVSSNHFNWTVTLSGSRTEREGYLCRFESSPSLQFSCEQAQEGWDYCYGAATMLILKDGEKVDMARMDFNGKKATFIRGL